MRSCCGLSVMRLRVFKGFLRQESCFSQFAKESQYFFGGVSFFFFLPFFFSLFMNVVVTEPIKEVMYYYSCCREANIGADSFMV